jgi:hypothetical protein
MVCRHQRYVKELHFISQLSVSLNYLHTSLDCEGRCSRVLSLYCDKCSSCGGLTLLQFRPNPRSHRTSSNGLPCLKEASRKTLI